MSNISTEEGIIIEVERLRRFRKEEIIKEDFIERQFYDLFILREFGLDDKTIHFQKEEVQVVKFVDMMELKVMEENNKIVPRPEVYDVILKYLFQFNQFVYNRNW